MRVVFTVLDALPVRHVGREHTPVLHGLARSGGFAVNAQLREAHIGREANGHTAGINPGIVHAGGAATLKGRAPGAAPIGSCASIRRKLGKPANW